MSDAVKPAYEHAPSGYHQFIEVVVSPALLTTKPYPMTIQVAHIQSIRPNTEEVTCIDLIGKTTVFVNKPYDVVKNLIRM